MTRHFLIAAEIETKFNSFHCVPYWKEKEFVVTSEQFDKLMLKDKDHYYEYKEVQPKVPNPRLNVSDDWEVISGEMSTESNYHIRKHERNYQTKCLKQAGWI